MPSPCPECGFDARGLSPADAAVALRTLPGRFRALTEPASDDPDSSSGSSSGSSEADAAVRRGGALAAAGQAAEAIAELGEDLRLVLIEDNPGLKTVGTEATATRHGGDPATALERLTAATTGLAALVTAQPSEAWVRTGTRATGPVSAADLLREAVHAGVHRLRGAERA